MRKLLFFVMTGLVVLSLLVSACGRATPEPTPVPPKPTPVPEEKFKVGMVSDVGGIDDASFNENTWKGLQDAVDALGVEAAFLESQAQADYEPNIIEFAEQGYDMIITVGFLLGDATYKMAAQYPDVKFAIVDYPADPNLTNLKGILFNVDEASFPVGYLAAAMADELDSEGPAVSYIGGMQIPPVEQFIVAYEAGVEYYNEKYGKDVGFTGVYVGDFEAPDQGKIQANSLIDEGADIIMGVGGKTGNGGIAAAKERGKWGVGVDVDQYYTLPNEKDILVTSTVKRLDKAVFSVIKDAVEGTFTGGDNYIATLANEGVGVGPFHDFEDKVPDNIKADLAEIQAAIIAGEFATGWPPEAAPPEVAFKVGMVSDVGGIDDASFNENTWKGLQDAVDALGVEAAFLESQAQADYEPNIIEFAEQGYDMIITVGFLLGDATYKMAAQYPDVKFAIVDYPADPNLTNLKGILFNVDEASFPVGYLAAAMADELDSEGPAVSYIGGMQIPPVEQFIVAYEAGVEYYNEKYGKDVGFTGVYVGDFEAPDQGKIQANSLIDEGADIIMGVGGKTGNGGIAAAKERGKWGVGVDVDQYYTLPNEKDILVTSTVKRLDKAVFSVIKDAVEGTFTGGDNYIATLANEGVGVGPFHDFEDKVPDNIKADLAEIQAAIIAGELATGWPPPAPPAAGELGSAEKPIKVLFVPSVDVGMIVSGGEIMAEALEKATAMKFEVSVPTSYAATIEAMCASPADTIGFIPALGYVIANQKCGVEVGAAAVRYGWSVYWAQYLVPRDSDYQSLEDLAGKKWAVPDLGSTSGYLFPLVELTDLGVEPGETVEAGGHPQAALALFNGEVDFATTFFSPPLTDPRWAVGDDPEPYDPFAVALNEAGRAFAGDVRVLDARASTLATAPDMYKETRVLALTDPIPNDTMSFGPDFPEAVRTQIIDALAKFMTTEACAESICSSDFYNWTGLDPIGDADYDIIRKLIALMGYTEEDIFGG